MSVNTSPGTLLLKPRKIMGKNKVKKKNKSGNRLHTTGNLNSMIQIMKLYFGEIIRGSYDVPQRHPFVEEL